MRWRVTVRGGASELRGFLSEDIDLVGFSEAMKPVGLVLASPAADDYDPFTIPVAAPSDSPEQIAEAVMRQFNVDSLEGFRDVTMGMVKRMIVAGINTAALNDLVE